MALQINTQIGTDRGITDSAYVRIADYQLHKSGFLRLQLEVYMSADDAVNLTNVPFVSAPIAKNIQIGDFLHIPLLKDVELTRTVRELVPITEEQEIQQPIALPDGTPSLDENGEPIMETVTRTVIIGHEEQDVIQTYTGQVADITPISEEGIFTFAYGKLKEKLETLFGENNIQDC